MVTGRKSADADDTTTWAQAGSTEPPSSWWSRGPGGSGSAVQPGLRATRPHGARQADRPCRGGVTAQASDRSATHSVHLEQPSRVALLRYHLGWQPGQAGDAAGGGAGRRPAKIAAAPMDQSREALLAARPLQCRCGHAGWVGYAIGGAGNAVGIDVGVAVGVKDPGVGPGVPGRPVGGAGLRSLPAKQHALKARPSPATDRGRRRPGPRAGRQARMAPASDLRGGGEPDIRA
jgi:hypothetical protein